MIKGVVGYKVKSYKDLEPILMKIRSHAMQYPGFVSAESLVSEVDSSVVVMMSTWETIENWRIWAKSRITQDLLRQAEAFLKEKPRITAYRIMPTVEWR
jgi:antibiotic biosynthesis monooxygenase (ABM) superfamily enzyme